MVVKALSWALRELAKREPAAVYRFLEAAGESVASRVRREVSNKLATGLKNPKRRNGSAKTYGPLHLSVQTEADEDTPSKVDQESRPSRP